ncbi:MAG: hypothetical protein UW99_C0020G0003 [Candidatus Collierbacteria bacterium GW2011_GWC2_45_15]|uniref:Uncharacterized protein n=2 Tax=Candidatus Collieribacteriota TaxID=1752725 RepID=A0A0G1P833_9BACT|nr:MAG: hypothetical protein UW99_C0020G0003 [Candidatus Collierbacteria bacterium GW2011_GWC2_45_15]KKU28772.1 MAG: hypothetical protein UX41_C0027G0003 [Candidatus Collierbacteria bacterium GW2011_GWE1_46_18]
MKLKLFLLTVLSVFGLLLPANSFAAGPLTVRLGQPKSPTNQNSIKLTFVAREIGGTSNITVSCYKKSPSDGGYVKFDVDKILIPGGNTDYCNVDGNILNTAGIYTFKVIADGLESNIVSVDYNNTYPSTPVSYSKEKINDCDYKIKFKTADDGRTVKVELYRSDTKTISLDSGGRVATQNIGPNTEGSFTNSVPTCGKEYFYVIRAVDSSDNVSGTTGDSNTVTTASTTTPTVTTQGALLAGETSQVTEGTPTGEATITPTDGTETTSTESGTPGVLGTQTSKWGNLKWLSIPLIIVAVFFFLKSKKRA